MLLDRYSKRELFQLWRNFRGQRDEVEILRAFALCDKATAQALIEEFRQVTAITQLDGNAFVTHKKSYRYK